MRLYPFQQAGVEYLTQPGSHYLADEMGLGKTVQAIAAVKQLGLKHALVIGPAGVLPNWRHTQREWDASLAQVTPVSYSYLLRHPDLFDGFDWDVVILDEAHYVKNPQAKRTLAALQVAAEAPRAWLLSGTPMPNHPGELFPPIRVLWPDIPEAVGATTYDQWFDHFTYWRWQQYGRMRHQRRKQPIRSRNLHLLAPHLQRIMLRREIPDVALDLPPLRIDVSYLEADSQFAEQLELLLPEDKRDQPGAVSKLRHYLGCYKAPRVADQIARELKDREYHKIVIMAHHLDVISLLEDRLRDFGAVTYTGETTPVLRGRAEELFRNDPSVRVFIGQQQAAGQGLNLQAASEIVLLEPDWSPGENKQAIYRVRRIGSESPVRARIFAVDDSLDDSLMKVVVRKAEGQIQAGLLTPGRDE